VHAKRWSVHERSTCSREEGGHTCEREGALKIKRGTCARVEEKGSVHEWNGEREMRWMCICGFKEKRRRAIDRERHVHT
jgi:hypothetical protein